MWHNCKPYWKPSIKEQNQIIFNNTLKKDVYCQQVSGSPDPEIEWLRDDQKIEQGDRGGRCRVTREEGKCSLEIQGVTPADEGEYSIVARNSAGIAQCTCQLLVDDCEY